MIRFRNAGKAFRSRRNKRELVWPLRHFTATIVQGESTAILSPNDSDKTTLIDLVAGTETLTEGEIVRTGHISWPASFRGMINPRMTARQNLRFLTDAYGHDFGAAYEFVHDFTELGRQMDQIVRQCTNEQRHRLAIAMLLAMNFEFILVDETFEAGDMNFRRKVTQFIDDNQDRITFFMATNNARLAERYCQRAGILVDGTVTFFDTMTEAVAEFRRYRKEDF
ncbi:MAG: ATP-binding cassette domain-containing protein [Rhizobiaceae bacterium]|nr:ATP-binding cassette domain-containing protein [Rhizobiaceae bacterium]